MKNPDPYFDESYEENLHPMCHCPYYSFIRYDVTPKGFIWVQCWEYGKLVYAEKLR